MVAQKDIIMRFEEIKTSNTKLIILGDYCIRFYKDGSSVRRIEEICRILKYLFLNGAKVQEVLTGESGNCVDRENKFWITRYYKGEFHDGRELQIRNLAHEIAKIHILLAKWENPFNLSLNERWYQPPTNVEWDKIYFVIDGLINPSGQDEIASLSKDLLLGNYDMIKRTSIAGHLQLIHFDLNHKNVLFIDDDVSVILDFNAMRKSDVEQDIAFSSFRFAFFLSQDITFIREYVRRFIMYYVEINPVDMVNYNHHLMTRLLYLTSYILKHRYLKGNSLIGTDLAEYVNLIKVASRGIYG